MKDFFCICSRRQVLRTGMYYRPYAVNVQKNGDSLNGKKLLQKEIIRSSKQKGRQ